MELTFFFFVEAIIPCIVLWRESSSIVTRVGLPYQILSCGSIENLLRGKARRVSVIQCRHGGPPGCRRLGNKEPDVITVRQDFGGDPVGKNSGDDLRRASGLSVRSMCLRVISSVCNFFAIRADRLWNVFRIEGHQSLSPR